MDAVALLPFLKFTPLGTVPKTDSIDSASHNNDTMKSHGNPMWACYLWTRALIGTPDFVLDLIQVCDSLRIVPFHACNTYIHYYMITKCRLGRFTLPITRGGRPLPSLFLCWPSSARPHQSPSVDSEAATQWAAPSSPFSRSGLNGALLITFNTFSICNLFPPETVKGSGDSF